MAILAQRIKVIRVICRLPCRMTQCLNHVAARDTLGDSNAEAVGGLAKQRPYEAHIAPWDGSHNIRRGISDADREDLSLGWNAQERLAQR